MDFGGKYVAATLIGQGASGRVYRARSVVFDRLVAVKVFHGTLADERLQRDFERECQVLGSLGGHPHIVAVHDGGITSDGHPYLVMAYYDQGSLPADQAIGPGVAAALAIAVAEALDAAHAQGVLHRDVKPQNVLRSSQGAVALADFGISVRSPAELTSAAATASYAAPEVLRDHQAATPASDVYGLAATLYNLLAGHPPHPPHPGETDLHYLQRVVDQPQLPLPPGIPAPLAAVVEAGLAKDPGARQPSARAFADALRSATGDTAGSSTPGTVPFPQPAGPTSAPRAAASATIARPPTIAAPARPPVFAASAAAPAMAAPAATAAVAVAAPVVAAPAAAAPAVAAPIVAAPTVAAPVIAAPAAAVATSSALRTVSAAPLDDALTDPVSQPRPDAVTFAAVTHTSARSASAVPRAPAAPAAPQRPGLQRKLLAGVGALLTTAAVIAALLVFGGRTGDPSTTSQRPSTGNPSDVGAQLPLAVTSSSLPAALSTTAGPTTPPGGATPSAPTTSPTGAPSGTPAVPKKAPPAAAPSRAPSTTSRTTPAKPYDRNGVLLGVPRISVNGSGIAVLTATAQVNHQVTFVHLQIAVRSSTGEMVDPHGEPFDVAFTDGAAVTSSRTISGSRHYIGGPFTAFMAYSLDGSTWVNGAVATFTAPG